MRYDSETRGPRGWLMETTTKHKGRLTTSIFRNNHSSRGPVTRTLGRAGDVVPITSAFFIEGWSGGVATNRITTVANVY